MLNAIRTKPQDVLSRLLVIAAVTLVLLTVAIQAGIHHGRGIERAQGEEAIVRQIAALLHTDGYDGELIYKDGDVRIVHPYRSARATRARAEAKGEGEKGEGQ